jgi:hypothetical protein
MILHAPHGSAGGFVDRLANSIGGRAGAASVFGPPVERDGVTVIPVAASRFGFGGGAGRTPDDKGEGGGGGGGGVSRPLGFIEVREGRARFRRITDPIAIGVGALALATAVALFARSAGRLGGACRACARRRAEESRATDHEPGQRAANDEHGEVGSVP